MTGPRRSSVRWMVRLLAVLGVLALGAAACGDDGNGNGGSAPEVNEGAPVDEGEPVDGGTLRVAVGAEIDMLYPVEGRWSLEGNLIGSSIYDTLMTFDEDRNLVPRLAESMEADDEGRVWTIRLRPGVQFHDGTPFDGEAVKLNIESRQDVAVSGQALELIDEVVVVDPLTVEVRMSGPWFGYDYTVAAQGGYMVAPSQINSENRSTDAIGTGPFRLDGSWSPGMAVRVARNDDYWGDRPHLDGIEFRALVDQTSRAASLRTGDVDMILTQDPGSVLAFRSDAGIVQVEDFAAEETIAMLNLGEPPLDNRNARLALAYATNREALNEVVGGGIQLDANQPYTEDEAYYVEDANYPDYDLDQAREHVELYQQETGESALRFTLTTPSSNQQQQEAELLQAQWAEAGIEVEIDTVDQAGLIADVFLGNFTAVMFRNFAYVNPDSNYIFWHSSFANPDGGINFGQLRSDEVDDALDTARQTQDDDTRIEQYRRAVRAINEDVAYVWLYHGVWGLAARDNVGGLSAPQALGFARQDGKPWWPSIWME
jgi:peptide/nickel transport system substrate-binding protein